MSAAPESIQVGQCYLMAGGQVKRVLTLMASGHVHYEYHIPGRQAAKGWKPGTQELRSFAFTVERPVPCDWTPETNEKGDASLA